MTANAPRGCHCDRIKYATKYRIKYASSARWGLHTRPLPPTESRKPCHTNANDYSKVWDRNHLSSNYVDHDHDLHFPPHHDLMITMWWGVQCGGKGG